MPEGPELHLASRLVNNVCNGRFFSGKVVKSEVQKNPEVDWDAEFYTISAQSRGKEVKLTLTESMKDYKGGSTEKNGQREGKVMHIIFRFGMSGTFKFTEVSDMHKHAHLNFFTKEDSMVLSYVDVRRFGKWEPDGHWAENRGPCIIFEYKDFRSHVLSNLEDAAFKRPLCEVMLNQKYFNGVGNYLRAEVLYRMGIPPFVEAYSVLKELDEREDIEDGKLLNKDNPDVIDMCTILAREVIELGATNYTEEDDAKDHSAFNDWLQCYYQPGMKNLADNNKRTVWFHGEPGPMVPRENKPRKLKKGKRKRKADENDEETKPSKLVNVEVKDENNDETNDEPRRRSRRTKVKVPKVEEEVITEVKPKRQSVRKVEKEASTPEMKSRARTKQTRRSHVTPKKVSKAKGGATAVRKGSSRTPVTSARSTRSRVAKKN